MSKLNIPYKGIYRKAFIKGYDYAFDGEDWGFGEHSLKEDYKHIPKNCSKKKYIEAWMLGNAYGVG